MRAWALGRARALAGAVLLLAPGRGVAQQVHSAPIERSWTRLDSAARKVDITLIAGMSGTNGGMSFNGVTRGALTVAVPVGWRVTFHFENADQMLPHSLVVVPYPAQVPVNATAPAFAGATTHRLQQGLTSDAKEAVTFVPDRPGLYMILCGVPGHAIAGMWLRLEVAPAPEHIGFEVTSP